MGICYILNVRYRRKTTKIRRELYKANNLLSKKRDTVNEIDEEFFKQEKERHKKEIEEKKQIDSIKLDLKKKKEQDKFVLEKRENAVKVIKETFADVKKYI